LSAKQHLIGRLLTVTLLLGAFLFSAVTVMYFALRGRTVEVPNLVGKSEEDAASELEDSGLRIQLKSRAHHEQIPLNAVTDQEPPAGAVVKTGQLVRVSLSLGAPPLETKRPAPAPTARARSKN
jgi:beta-lactam-binding protein with PASTA domain